jgi:DNA-binding NarL/FixJ family response regulator
VVASLGLVRAGIRALLETIPDVRVVAHSSEGEEALRLASAHKPDVVCIDLSTERMRGLDTMRRLGDLRPSPPVLAISADEDRESMRQAVGAGARAYVFKSAGPEALTAALAAVARGDTWSPAPGDPASAPRTATLTPRQREVLRHIAEGHSTKEIARRLGISVKTVETHRAQIMERIDVRHVPGLVRYAMRTGIVPPEV